MIFGKKQKKRVREALKNTNLEQALKRASSHHYEKYNKTIQNIPWEEYKNKTRSIKEECLKNLPQLVLKFTEEATRAGANVYLASTPTQALDQINKIAQQKKAKLIVKAKSMVSEEIGLNDFLEKKGYKVVETDLGEWIVQLAKERPSHITAPALHKTKEEVAEIISKELNSPVPPEPQEIMKAAREKMREYFIRADIGISGANLAIAESGTLMIISNEGNARLVTTLPPVHIALVTIEKFVETLEQASTIAKTLTIASSGYKLTAYVSFITGPSRTTDVEKELVIGAHGPKELHIIILDNERLKLTENEDLNETLFCLKCGGCMLVCPVFQAVGGHVFGGPVYQGGIGLLMSLRTEEMKKIAPLFDFCADCKKCEVFCPVGIPTSEILLKLKNTIGPNVKERGLSALFKKKTLVEAGAKILQNLQKPWEKNGYLKKIPLGWAKGKSIPAINLKKIQNPPKKKGKKIYLFQGCLAKFFFPEIRESVLSSLSQFGYNVVCPKEQACCGAPSLHVGDKKGVRKQLLKNLVSFEKEDPDYIITICPTGNSMLKKTYPEIEQDSGKWMDRIFDFTEFLVLKEHLQDKSKSKKKEIFYHYPCHYINELEIGDKPKKLIESLGFSVKEEEEPYTCCGFCGVFSIKNQEISSRMWERKKQKILENQADLIATDCPGCLFQMKSNLEKEDRPFKIVHTAELTHEFQEKK